MALIYNSKHTFQRKIQRSCLITKDLCCRLPDERKKQNNGELPKYYIEDGHETIISTANRDVAQAEIAHRKKFGKSYSSNTILSSKLICEDCGCFFGSKVWHSTSKYRRVIYRCNQKYESGEKCQTPHLTEEEIKEAFLKAYNIYMGDRKQVIADITVLCDFLSDTTSLDTEIVDSTAELEETARYYKLLISQSPGNPDFNTMEQKAYKKYIKLSDKVDTLTARKVEIITRKVKLQNYAYGLKSKKPILDEWDNKL